ncbi:MAG: Asp-tRNA(Asn)/Glu-tRNA(Gln) amidotransferase subunit GatC [Candidatus Fonsibacter sp.]|jgi:aspartyl-tRNA(Asn)/glutamyl-tRNA(Gln) amidotransferase subunit C|nr:Asp-tRNA(Asn)/Glu-tRNA(Gln) amidotransferase subunit GatC [Pelagibacterales bacterium]
MSINKETVKKISKLARISVSDQQASKLEKNLNSILSFVEQLNELNTEKINPISTISNQKLIMRDDVVKVSNQKEDILKNAPEKNSSYYIVPKVVE